MQNWAGEPAHVNNAYMNSSNPSSSNDDPVSPKMNLNMQLSNAKIRRPGFGIGSSVKKANVFAYRETSAVKSQEKQNSAQKGWIRSEGSSNGKNLSKFVTDAFADEQPTSAALTKFADNDVLGARNLDSSTEKALHDKIGHDAFDDVPTPDVTEPASSLALGNLQDNGAGNLLPYFGQKGFDEELELRSSSEDPVSDPAALRSSSSASFQGSSEGSSE